MIVRIFGSNYKLDNNLASLVKTSVYDILNQAKLKADENGRPQFYTTYVIMMYVVSSAILKQMNTENIKEIVQEIQSEQNKKK